jgi:hypothetical protein
MTEILKKVLTSKKARKSKKLAVDGDFAPWAG